MICANRQKSDFTLRENYAQLELQTQYQDFISEIKAHEESHSYYLSQSPKLAVR